MRHFSILLAALTFLSYAGQNLVAQQATAAPAAITLDEAIARARRSEPALAAARAASSNAAIDRSIARAALLPTVTYHNAYLFTQANGSHNQAGPVGSQSSPRFIANNAVHEYSSQAVVSETIGLAQLNEVNRAAAAAAIASAELEISRRGLTATVVALFYTATTARDKAAVEQRAADEATSFVKLTVQREAQREGAHADVLKAELTEQQRRRDLADAVLAAEKARVVLAVLLFPDPRTPYEMISPAPATLPTRADVEAAAESGNPELQSALAILRSANLNIKSAQAAYLPDLALNYTYGIDAEQFAVNGPGGVRNLGYSASATLDIPVWDWFSTQHRIRQTQILRDSARVALSSAQRTLIAQLDESYNEASLAQQQLASLQVSVDTARESLRLTRLRYTAGESTVLEVVDAEGTLTAAEIAQADGTLRYQQALADLQLLTGTLPS
ncbi:TolC family protein [Acidipila sp. EB88]|uniref:TolC family protein n=1 Tax=Acidipila sp. EB88 TaxID=2305226 RepID=UPI000F5E4F52|nr:TolC family protein [Acidipila sp. EB88]RRA49592.1 TolC family protein [Acidipila sp. EB88]